MDDKTRLLLLRDLLKLLVRFGTRKAAKLSLRRNVPGKPIPFRIALSGHIGAGKSMLRKRLAKRMGLEEFRTSQTFHDLAEAKGLEIGAFYKSLETDPSIDLEVDRRAVEFLRSHERAIVEGRVLPFIAPEIPKVKIFLKVDLREAVRRISKRPDYRDKKLGEIARLIIEREEMERERYRDIYHIPNHLDETYFDIVIDTSRLSKEETFREVVDKLTEWISKNFFRRFWQ